MKIINRIIFGLLAALGLMLVASITDEYFRSREIESYAKEVIADENYTEFISTAYYKEQPVYDETITIESNTYLVFVYDVIHIKQTTDSFEVVEGFQMIVIEASGTPLDSYFDVYVSYGLDQEVNYAGFNLYSLGVYMFYEPNTNASFMYDDTFMVDDQFQDITNVRFEKEGTLIFDLDITLSEDMLTMKQSVQDYIDLNQETPENAIDGLTYKEPLVIDLGTVVIRNSVIYLVVVIVLYYVLFIRKRKTLGDKEATLGVVKDIERLNEEKKSDE